MSTRSPQERGSATVLCLAIVGVLVGLTAGVTAVAGAGVAKQRAAAAADAAALAAADAVSGAIPGTPCGQAQRLAVANGATLAECSIDGPTVLVKASVGYLGFVVAVSARAGPPGARAGTEQEVDGRSVEDGLEKAVLDSARALVECIV